MLLEWITIPWLTHVDCSLCTCRLQSLVDTHRLHPLHTRIAVSWSTCMDCSLCTCRLQTWCLACRGLVVFTNLGLPTNNSLSLEMWVDSRSILLKHVQIFPNLKYYSLYSVRFQKSYVQQTPLLILKMNTKFQSKPFHINTFTKNPF